jgi:hypothetical protein
MGHLRRRRPAAYAVAALGPRAHDVG